MDVDPDILCECHILRPCLNDEGRPEIFAHWWPVDWRRKHVRFGSRLFEYIDELGSWKGTIPEANRIGRNDRVWTVNIKPIIVAELAIPDITSPADLGKIVKPHLDLLSVARNLNLEGFWGVTGYYATRTYGFYQAADY